MCNELFLALIYFTTIIIVNFFLLKLLKISFENLVSFAKTKNLLNSFKIKNHKLLNFLLFSLYNEKKINVSYLNELLSTKDILIIGYTYNYLLKNQKEEFKENFAFQKTYLKLLELQYLSLGKNLK
jgi:hypothetical protein